jgi:hypothetical protein
MPATQQKSNNNHHPCIMSSFRNFNPPQFLKDFFQSSPIATYYKGNQALFQANSLLGNLEAAYKEASTKINHLFNP